jgi:hypothetical protein
MFPPFHLSYMVRINTCCRSTYSNATVSTNEVLYLDARYEKVRVDGQIRDTAILITSGIGKSGRRQILGVSVSLSEAEVH